ncbi:peroxisomal copper amine oxidase [Vararia minispora EC-137]|uniref:Peroxisomal copper amine oxidase n=1 Tax=Vararia minispora EC-137 TaxID=1314806 RepID=A0ACB8QB97_9AGAM|nr:peroxisomal copper amine oxidase [Vararia minispora EC-137]
MTADGTNSATKETTAPSTATDIQHSTKPNASFPPPTHPLDPLVPDEIVAISLAVRAYTAEHTPVKAIRFITNYLLPPPKRHVLAHLGIPLTPGAKVEEADKVPLIRRAEVDFIDVVNGDSYNTIVALDAATEKWSVETITKLPEGQQPQISPEELIACEEIVRNDPHVQALAKEVGIEPHQIFADGWSVGYDDRFPLNMRLQQALLFARFSQHDNLYAHPLDFVPVVDMLARKVVHIDFAPTYSGKDGALSVKSTAPAALDTDSLTNAARARIPPALAGQNFLPDLMREDAGKKGETFTEREAPKPLHVIQPEGVSFKMDGHVLEWQKWKMHIAFSHREGIALSTITYNDNGEVRPIFYRLSVAEMVVPYGAPEHPHPRKFAFDSGEYGMGTMANELALGCDCLGQIHYLPGTYTANDGSAVVIKNVICIHEEDAGLLWKHTDYRVGGRSMAVRSRRLVVQMICTLANYEYIWNYIFYQDGTIELEIRLTGILQVYTLAQGESVPYGVQVAPGINAQNHQHMFSLRVDPMVDGLHNSVIETDVLARPEPTGADANFAGNGFFTCHTTLRTARDGARDFDAAADRRWRIVNPSRTHPSTGAPVGFTIGVKGAATPWLPRPDGWVGRRANFAQHTVWVVRDRQDARGMGRMWPAGKFVPQAREEPKDSLLAWQRADGEDSIDGEDVLVYVTIGTTHIPRPEDWPVMPADHLRVHFKPNSFFTANPAMDVPGNMTDPKSVPAFANGDACCH